jgi:pyridoxal phosphate enzyme (YggS family)
LERREALPSDCEWHLIGSLQTNKVKYISEFITLIHSVDSLKLAQEIDKQAQKQGRCIDILLQTRVAQEDSKQGVPPNEFPDFVSALLKDPMPGIRIRGIMGMASFVEDTQQIHQEFSAIETLFNETKHRFFSNDALFSELSIGMSGDYRLALQHGATLVRIGSAIFQ